MSKTLVLIAFCSAFILFGLVAAGSLYSDLGYANASLSWPSVEGEVTQSVRRRGNSKLKRLEYAYEVNRVGHAGTRAAYLRMPYSTPLHKVYRSGQRVEVRYDPANPERSVLAPGASTFAVIVHSLIPILLIGFGSAGLFYGLRR